MTIAPPFKVGFVAQKIRLVPNGTYKAFLFELWDILHSVVPLGLNATVNSWYPTFKGWAIVKHPSGIRAKS